MHCCRSRLGGRRLVFQPYNREQLKDIVLARLADAGASAAFNPRAIEYAARKVPQATLRKVAVEKHHQRDVARGLAQGVIIHLNNLNWTWGVQEQLLN